MTKKVTEDTQVWSAAAWWRDSDPSMQVVTLSATKTNTLIRKMMKEAARYAADNDDMYSSVSAAMDGIAWSGAHSFNLGTLASKRELSRAIADLESDGVWYPDVG